MKRRRWQSLLTVDVPTTEDYSRTLLACLFLSSLLQCSKIRNEPQKMYSPCAENRQADAATAKVAPQLVAAQSIGSCGLPLNTLVRILIRVTGEGTAMSSSGLEHVPLASTCHITNSVPLPLYPPSVCAVARRSTAAQPPTSNCCVSQALFASL